MAITGAGFILVGLAMMFLALGCFRMATASSLLAVTLSIISLCGELLISNATMPILYNLAQSSDWFGRGYADIITSTALGLAALSILTACPTIVRRLLKCPAFPEVDDVLGAAPRFASAQTSICDLLAVFLASVVLALGTTALIGYLSGVEAALSWQQSNMALPTAIASTIFGVGMIGYLWGQARTLPLWFAIPFGVGFIAITLSLVHSVQRYEDQRFRQSIGTEAKFVATQIDLRLSDLFLSLDRMVDRWTTLGNYAERTWKRDAEAELKAYPFATAVEWVDSNSYVRWIVPERGNEALLGIKLNADSERSAAFLRAKETRIAQVTKALPLLQGGTGVIRFTPLHARNRFDGMIACVVNPSLLLEHITALHLPLRYSLTLRDGPEIVFTSQTTHDASEVELLEAWSKTVKIDLPDRDWTLTVTPTLEILADKNSLLPLLVLGAGLTISFVAAFLIFLTLKWRAMSETLRERGDRLRSIMNNTVEGIITINSQGIMETFNPACEAMFGISAQAAIGQNVSILMPHAYAIHHDEHLRRYMETGESRIIGKGREVEGLRQDGSIFPLDLSVSRFESHGKVMFCGIVRDISERKHFQRLQEEFTAIASHELRTPLTCIRGAIGLIANSSVPHMQEREVKLVNIALRNSERLAKIVNDLLDTEKIKSGKLPLVIEPISAAHLLKQVLEDNSPISDSLKIPFVLTSDPSEVTILADYNRMLQVFSNLLSNAAKFSRSGGEVHISLEQKNGSVKFMVRDFGIGIPEDFRPHIFSKFAQSTSNAKQGYEGSGLGLLITKALIENMGGTLSYSSAPGKGTTFIFDLPCAKDAA
ncbi:MAG: ATP-binding protein [Bdellovibrionales bacterium]